MRDSASVLARKVALHGAPAIAAPGPAERFHLALARVIERRFALALTREAAVVGERTTAEILDTLPDQPLLVTLDGPDAALGGLAILDQGALAALGEVVTLGALSPSAPRPRRPTRTDAILLGDVLDQALDEFDRLASAGEAGEQDWTAGYRYGAHLADARPLPLMLDAPFYRVIRLAIGFGAGAERHGALTLVLPARERIAQPGGSGGKPETGGGGDGAAQPTDWGTDLAAAIAPAETDLTAILARVTLPLGDILALQAGQSLLLPPGALDRVLIEGAGERLVCLARLGQKGGQRAVRLTLQTAVGAPPMAPPVEPSLLVAAADQALTRPPAVARRGAQTLTDATADRPEVPATADGADTAIIDDAAQTALARAG